MRLHARLVEPGFWSDIEFAGSFGPLERHFYLGLIQLADDSGCLADSVLEFKAKLYPVDFDITPAQVQGWRDHLAAAGLVVPYCAGGKRCLYLANFARHQKKRYYDAPEVPLPPWVRWEPYPTAAHRGTYTHSAPTDEGLATTRSNHGADLVQKWSGSATTRSTPGAESDRKWSEPATDANANANALGRGQGEPRVGPSADAEGAPPVPAAPPDVGAPPPGGEDEHEHDGEQGGSAGGEQVAPPADPLLAALDRLRGAPGYVARVDDLRWLQDLAAEFSGVDVCRTIGDCREWYAPKDARPRAKAANWRLRVRNFCQRAHERLPQHARASPAAAGKPQSMYRDIAAEAASW